MPSPKTRFAVYATDEQVAIIKADAGRARLEADRLSVEPRRQGAQREGEEMIRSNSQQDKETGMAQTPDDKTHAKMFDNLKGAIRTPDDKTHAKMFDNLKGAIRTPGDKTHAKMFDNLFKGADGGDTETPDDDQGK